MTTFAEGMGAAFERKLIVFALLATTLPYVVAFYATPGGFVFTWILPPYPEDLLAYLAWSRQALEGALVFRLKYTTAAHEPMLFQPFFYLAGLLSRLTRLDLGIIHLLLKSIGVLVFFWALFGLLRVLKVPAKQARLAGILVAVSSGIGGLLAVSLSPETLASLRPADLWLVDLNTYWSLLWNPLFPFSLALIVYCIRWIVEGVQTEVLSCWWKAGLATAVLALIHPYHVPMLYLLFVISSVTKLSLRNWMVASLYYFVVSLPAVAFVAFQPNLHPVLADHAVTGRMDSPGLLGLALGCGLLLIGAVVAIVRGSPEFSRAWPLVLWLGLSLGLAYSPFWFQRKFLFGLQLPLCILTACIMVRLLKPFWRWVIVGIMATTPLYLTHGQYREMHASSDTNPYYVRSDLMEAMKFLRQSTDPDTVVFASYEVSRLIPAFSGNTAVWGHWAQSVDLQETLRNLQSVFAPNSGLSDTERAGHFWKLGIEYLIDDTSLKTTLGGELPAWLSAETQVVWQSGDTRVLKRHPQG